MRGKWLFVGLGCAVLVAVCSCGVEEKDWETARAQDTISAYESFIVDHPEGEHTPKARTRILDLRFQSCTRRHTVEGYRWFVRSWPDSVHAAEAEARIQELYAARRPELRNVRNADIVARLDFPKGVQPYFDHVSEVASALLRCAGIKPVVSNEGGASTGGRVMTLELSITGSALGQRYSTDRYAVVSLKRNYLYTGARINGCAAIVVDGKTVAEKRCRHEIPPPKSVSGTVNSLQYEPQDAPLDRAWDKAHCHRALFDMISEEFGREVLVDAMPAVACALEERDIPGNDCAELVALMAEVTPRERIVPLLRNDPWSSLAPRLAARSLQVLGDSWAIDALIDVLGTPRGFWAARALGQMDAPPPRVLEALERMNEGAYTDGDIPPEVYGAVFEALQTLRKKGVGEN